MMDERLDDKRYNQKLVRRLFPEKKSQKNQQFVLFVGINHVQISCYGVYLYRKTIEFKPSNLDKEQTLYLCF